MDRLFSLSCPVAPFVIAPNAQLGTEASYVFAPLELTARPHALRALLFDPVRDGPIISPVIGQLCRIGGAVIATCTIKATSRESVTGRTGQVLVIGVRAAPRAFLYRGWVLCRGFALLCEFLEQAAGHNLSPEGAGIVIEAIERSRDLNALLLRQLPCLLAGFEPQFHTGYTNRSRTLGHLRFLKNGLGLLARRRTLPAASHRDLDGYWAFVDSRLQRRRPDEILRNQASVKDSGRETSADRQ